MFKSMQTWFEENLFATADGPNRRPQLSAHNESNIPGLFVVGDLAGAPVIKLAMEQGYNVIEHIASQTAPTAATDADLLDVLVMGAGAAGLNATLAAKDRGLSCVLLEKAKIANSIENFPESGSMPSPTKRRRRASYGWTVPKRKISSSAGIRSSRRTSWMFGWKNR